MAIISSPLNELEFDSEAVAISDVSMNEFQYHWHLRLLHLLFELMMLGLRRIGMSGRPPTW
jgi:hypothetical protein